MKYRFLSENQQYYKYYEGEKRPKLLIISICVPIYASSPPLSCFPCGFEQIQTGIPAFPQSLSS